MKQSSQSTFRSASRPRNFARSPPPRPTTPRLHTTEQQPPLSNSTLPTASERSRRTTTTVLLYPWQACVASLQQLRRYFLSKSRSGMSVRTRKTARTCGGFWVGHPCIVWGFLALRMRSGQTRQDEACGSDVSTYTPIDDTQASTHPPTYLCAIDLGHGVARLGVRVRQRVVHRLYIHTWVWCCGV